MTPNIRWVAIITICVFASSCTRHEPPEEVIRTLCADYVSNPVGMHDSALSGTTVDRVSVEVLEIQRKGLGQSSNTRGIPDNKLVYPISCLISVGAKSEHTRVFLYFYKNANGEWVVRSRK